VEALQKIVAIPIITIIELCLLMQLIQANESSTVIVICPDGTVDPPTAPILKIGATYVFTEEIHAGIVVQRSNMIIDGRNFAIKGNHLLNSTGILLSNVKGVTVKRVNVTGFFYAVKMEESENCIMTENNITNNDFGIWIERSDSNIVSKNIFSNLWSAVTLKHASKNQIFENKFSNNIYGIMLEWSFENTLTKNIFTENDNSVDLALSSRNFITENFVRGKSKGSWYSIRLHSSSNNTIRENSIECTFYALSLLYYTKGNLIISNNVSQNSYGIVIWYAINNTIYHNRFIDNTEQAKCYSFQNKWDAGYPDGGNYWSNYVGTDEKSGSNQDQLGSDGIGDIPYIIDDKNIDRYPIMGEFPKPKSNQYPILHYAVAIAVSTCLGIAAFAVYRTRKKPKA
jgi:parallel beta-helix repeat protein